MEPSIYKPIIYKTPGIYKGAGGIYKGLGVYNNGAGGGDIGDILHYKTDFSNFDLGSLIDTPEEGPQMQYTLINGTVGAISINNGLFINNYATIRKELNIDFSLVSRIRIKGVINLHDGDFGNSQWCYAFGITNSANFWSSNRGQGLSMFAQNLQTSYFNAFSENIEGMATKFCVKEAGISYKNEDVESIFEWDNNGDTSYKHHGENAGNASGIIYSNNLGNFFSKKLLEICSYQLRVTFKNLCLDIYS